MKVAVIVSDLTYPPREGLHQHTILFLQTLTRIGVEIRLAGYCCDTSSLDELAMSLETGIEFSIPPLTRRGPSLATGLRNRVPMFRNRDAKRLLRWIDSQDDDVIHLEGAAACGLLRKRSARKTVVSFMDPGSRRQLRLAKASSRLYVRLIRTAAAAVYFFFELTLNRSVCTWHVVSDEDSEHLKRIHKHARTFSVPIMLPIGHTETKRQSPANALEGQAHALILADLRQSFMVDGLSTFMTIAVRPNLARINCTISVLGRSDPPPKLEAACAGLGIEFVKWVPDYTLALSGADLIILPDTVGTGLKTRTVQSLGLGKAVLGSTVAFEGIGAEHNANAIIYHNLTEAGEHLVRLCSDPRLREDIGRRAGALAVERFSSGAVGKKWAQLYACISGLSEPDQSGLPGPDGMGTADPGPLPPSVIGRFARPRKDTR